MKVGTKPKVRLSDICSISSALIDPRQGNYLQMRHVGGANIESMTGKLIDLKTAEQEGLISEKFLFDESMVLYSKIRPYLIKVARPDFRGLCSADIYPLSPNSGHINRDFLYYLLFTKNFTDYAIIGSARAGMPKVNREHLFAFEFPLPPLVEQQRIVGILDEAFAGLATAKANTEKNLQNARAIFESHLQAVFTQRGEGWVERKLSSLCNEITVGHVGSMKTEYKEVGIPFLRSQNIRPFEVSMENAMFIDDAFHQALKKSQLRSGDLAIVRTGYPGTAAVIPPELPDSNCSDLVIVRPTKEVSPHFLAAFFNSAFGKQLVLGKIVGAAQKHFNVTAAKDVKLHLPPISAQLKVIQSVADLRVETQHLESIYQQKLSALEALKKSLLHRAFNGEL